MSFVIQTVKWFMCLPFQPVFWVTFYRWKTYCEAYYETYIAPCPNTDLCNSSKPMLCPFILVSLSLSYNISFHLSSTPFSVSLHFLTIIQLSSCRAGCLFSSLYQFLSRLSFPFLCNIFLYANCLQFFFILPAHLSLR